VDTMTSGRGEESEDSDGRRGAMDANDEGDDTS
jgi:hypothetical protein